MSENITLFEAQKKIYPRQVWGFYRRLKWLLIAFFMAVYYGTPWLRWDRGPGLPDQAVLIDMGNRRAYFFFIEIWPQEVYYLTGILILAAVTLFFVTSLLGRVWCGYACFQTVWTDLFVKMEQLFQGDRNARIKLDAEPWGFNKIWRKTATHISWVIIGALTGGAFVFYFNDAPTLFHQIMTVSVPTDVCLWIAGLTASTYIMAGFAREQVCAYMCPYARFQSGMFDRDTLIISYDAARGEPRQPHKKGDSWDGRGDCVDCDLCVAVCPVGIDIRNGLQMECIACGLCVDACNSVMDKVGRPHGLVRYDTENNYEKRAQAKSEGHACQDKLRVVRPRTVYYAVILTLVAGLMIAGLATRKPYDLHALHERNPLYVHLSSGAIRNNYTLKILNKTHQERVFELSALGMPMAQLAVDGAGDPDPAHLRVPMESVGEFRVRLTVPSQSVDQAPRDFVLRVTESESHAASDAKTMFISGDR